MFDLLATLDRSLGVAPGPAGRLVAADRDGGAAQVAAGLHSDAAVLIGSTAIIDAQELGVTAHVARLLERPVVSDRTGRRRDVGRGQDDHRVARGAAAEPGYGQVVEGRREGAADGLVAGCAVEGDSARASVIGTVIGPIAGNIETDEVAVVDRHIIADSQVPLDCRGGRTREVC